MDLVATAGEAEELAAVTSYRCGSAHVDSTGILRELDRFKTLLQYIGPVHLVDDNY